MMKRSLKRRLLRAKLKLNQTIDQILDINKNRKRHSQLKSAPSPIEFEEELKVLNKIAEQQAKLVQHYESALVEK
ncbi:MAG: hypothetical protein HRU40_11925 [Saprospiraceae bacterium]|nr:hypothetical protein [Saprospiraceae bacterium]